mmetsp:Transcript_3100/g.5868  ORF Transcript_3100/g.5868 Transcript_3100/m.5868 type:complete len:203 (-) Transcript_3100:2770-3378(-)
MKRKSSPLLSMLKRMKLEKRIRCITTQRPIKGLIFLVCLCPVRQQNPTANRLRRAFCLLQLLQATLVILKIPNSQTFRSNKSLASTTVKLSKGTARKKASAIVFLSTLRVMSRVILPFVSLSLLLQANRVPSPSNSSSHLALRRSVLFLLNGLLKTPSPWTSKQWAAKSRSMSIKMCWTSRRVYTESCTARCAGCITAAKVL